MIDKEFKLLSQFNRKMEPTEFDYIVVGAGINGSWSALHLAKQGFKTLLLDQVLQDWEDQDNVIHFPVRV